MLIATPSLKLPLLLRRAAALLPLLCLTLLAQAQVEYLSLSYTTTGALNREVRFKVTQALIAPVPRQVGAVFTTGLDFGDGTPPEPVRMTVTSVSSSEYYAEGTLTHPYATSGTFTAAVTACCLPDFNNMRNNANQPVRAATQVLAGATNDSPVVTLPGLVFLAANQPAATYQVPASDPNGDPLTYSVATAADLGLSGFVNAPGLRVDPTTGVVTFNTMGRGAEFGVDLFQAVIKVSDGKTSVLVSHLIRVSSDTVLQPAPVFTAPTPADRQEYNIAAGQQLRFTVAATNGRSDRFIELEGYGLPVGATATPELHTENVTSAQTTISWTPTAAEIGTTAVLHFVAKTDGVATTTVLIHVIPVKLPPLCIAGPAYESIRLSPDEFTTLSGPFTFTPAQLLANDTDPLNRPLRVVSVTPPSRGRLVPNADGSYTYTPAPGFVGTVNFQYLVQLAGPVLAFPGTRHYYEFVSAPGISWPAARAAAAARTYQGLLGYLATVTAAAEKDFLVGRVPGQYWFGAADEEVEGEWRWKTGPEANQIFWRGPATGTAAGYTHWIPNQPDDYKNPYRPAGEDYAQFYGQSGLWNDLDEGGIGGRLAGYLVEYGGLEACVPELFATTRISITVGSAPQNRGMMATAGAAAGQTMLEALPNPSSGQFQLRVTATTDGPAQVELFDLQGRRVKTLFTGDLRANEMRELPVDAPELAAGVYLVRLQSGRQVQHLRLAVQH